MRRTLLLVIALLAGACASHSARSSHAVAPTTSTSTTSTTVDPTLTVVATARVAQVAAYDTPSDATPSHTLDNPRPLGGPLVFVVAAQEPGWIHAELPVRPNGTLGWIHTADVALTEHNFKIVVSLSGHTISVYQGHGLIDQEAIGVGRGATPTPGGTYFTEDFVKVEPATGPYGPYAYGLSGFSDVLTSFGGGPGQLAIHGTNDPAGLGQDVSHGCIRMSNAGITKLAAILPIGVPVEVDD